MAIWSIPEEYLIGYSQNGDDLNELSYKTKYCLEEAFISLKELHETDDRIAESLRAVESVSGGKIGGIEVKIESIKGGQIIVYRESDNKFHNEDQESVGEAKSLIICNGEVTLADYNGSETVTLDLSSVGGGSSQDSSAQEIEHLKRLVGNLYLALDVAGLNPGGYDGLSGETFYGNTNDIDTTAPKVTSLIQGNDSIVVSSADGLVEGSVYLLTDGTNSSWVKIKQIRAQDTGAQVVLQEAVSKQFDIDSTRLRRSRGTIREGGLSSREGVYSSRGSFFVTNVIPFVNEVSGEEKLISKAYLIVKHQNVADAEIIAEIAMRETPTFVKDEILAISLGTEQTARLANQTNLTSYKFALYFDGKKQIKDFSFDPTTGQVVFTAPVGSVVSADYFYNWGEENFVAMTKTGVYPDRRNPNRVTTQFAYTGAAGKVATLRLILRRGKGNSEITVTGADGVQRGFRLEHQAILGEIQATPATATVTYDELQNIAFVVAPTGQEVKINYNWRGKSFSIDSFVCMFDE